MPTYETTFEQLLQGLSDLRSAAAPQDAVLFDDAKAVADSLADMETLDIQRVADLLQAHPTWTPFIATCVGLSQEQLKNTLRYWFGTTSWRQVARRSAHDLVTRLESEYGLLERLAQEHAHAWSFADILVERSVWSRSRAVRSVGRGRGVEDKVREAIVEMGLDPGTPGRFTGRNGETAPCDIRVLSPTGDPLIVGAAKGFNSTGSKLTDAVREIQQMADVRLSRQFVFAVVDGIGWLSRQADLRRIHQLRVTDQIDGLYTLTRLDELRADILQAARLRHLID